MSEYDAILATHRKVQDACPFTHKSTSGEAWLLGAAWGSEEREMLYETIADLKVQLAALDGGER